MFLSIVTGATAAVLLMGALLAWLNRAPSAGAPSGRVARTSRSIARLQRAAERAHPPRRVAARK